MNNHQKYCLNEYFWNLLFYVVNIKYCAFFSLIFLKLKRIYHKINYLSSKGFNNTLENTNVKLLFDFFHSTQNIITKKRIGEMTVVTSSRH